MPTEDAFDHLTIPAAQICAASTLLILLADKNRQRCKSKPDPAAPKITRDFSCGGHDIHSSGLLNGPKATGNPWRAGNHTNAPGRFPVPAAEENNACGRGTPSRSTPVESKHHRRW
jgi:hypothetical protein